MEETFGTALQDMQKPSNETIYSMSSISIDHWLASYWYDNKDGFVYNRAGNVKCRALINNEDLSWSQGSESGVEGEALITLHKIKILYRLK